MWAVNLLLILLVIFILCQVLIWTVGFILAGKKSFGGFRKGLKRHSLSSSMIATTTAGVFLAVQAPAIVVCIAFFASFISAIFILLGNDEDNNQFRKL
jgi:hypothetical protein